MITEKFEQANVALRREFPAIEHSAIFSLQDKLDPEDKLPYSLYGTFSSQIIPKLLLEEDIEGFSLEKVIEFINAVYDNPEADIEFINLIDIEWLQPMASIMKNFKDQITPTNTNLIRKYLRGKALAELKFNLGEGPAPEYQ